MGKKNYTKFIDLYGDYRHTKKLKNKTALSQYCMSLDKLKTLKNG